MTIWHKVVVVAFMSIALVNLKRVRYGYMAVALIHQRGVSPNQFALVIIPYDMKGWVLF